MWKLSILFVVALVSTSNAQTVDCSQRPVIPPPECCPGSMTKLITKEIASTCGLPSEMADGPPPGPPPSGGPGAGGPGGPGGRGPMMSCDTMTCILKNVNVLGSDGKIDRAALKTYLEGLYTAEWKPAIEASLNECMAVDTSTSNCPNDAIMRCLKMTLVKNCPASIWVSSDDCTAVKSHLQQCAWKGKP